MRLADRGPRVAESDIRPFGRGAGVSLAETRRAGASASGSCEVIVMLMPCPECKSEVSVSARTCPQCGGRLPRPERLVSCPHCEAEVVPESSPHDTISRYCPACKRPITGLTARKAFLAASGAAFLGMLIALAWLLSSLASRPGAGLP
ncbi:Double zinc ribbon [Aquisphaera giovannonii]|uniref:Double zinc ribbon n=1 Tax=Aquisphaera giovannonii TaxID=406548 RepID=A0A5B9VV83_9BACT|nr:zinc ribbon domain-containing protein [Aquisphaera giovannonii]QEH31741.1 Double zinc ribbon [Aquisphaera giovannonii]